MNKQTTLLLSLALSAAAQAAEISPAQAEAIALQFSAKDYSTKSVSSKITPTVAYTATSETAAQNLLYVVNRGNNGGYVIVAGDDAAQIPVLGYTDSGTFDYDQAPANLKGWLSEYARQIEYMASHGINAAQQVSPRTFDQNVEPMITTHWNQDAPYNEQCPTLDNGRKAYTGCVATAMAQVMNFHEWPQQGTGSNSYYDNPQNGGCGQTLSADFGSTTYQWNHMLDDYDASSSQEARDAVATLMFHCGVAVNMTYMEDASGASSYTAADALVRYFGYPADVQVLSRDYHTYDEWVATIKGEIDARRPVLFSAQSTVGGHEFIIDGYNTDGYFHVNWGWGGQSDGYYLIATLNPYEGQGIGGGSDSGFKYMQDITINVEPPTGDEQETYEIAGGGLAAVTTTSSAGSTAEVSLEYIYNLSRQYVGVYAGAEIVNEAGETISKEINTNLPYFAGSGYLLSYSATLPFTIPADIAEGSYRIYPVYRNIGDETPAGRIKMASSGQQYVSMTVDSEGQATFSNTPTQWENLATANITVTENPTFTSGGTTTITVDITNNNDGTFSGPLSFALFEQESDKLGYSPQSLYQFDIYTIAAGETQNVEISLAISDFTPTARYYRIAVVNNNLEIIGTPQLIRVTNPTISLATAPSLLPSNDNVDCNNVRTTATLNNTSSTEEFEGTVRADILVAGRFTTLDSKNVTIEAGGSLTVEFDGTFTNGEVGETYSLFIVDANNRQLFPYTNFTVTTAYNDGTTTVENAVTNDATMVYPNPVGEQLNIDAAEDIAQATIYGITGTMVASVGGNGTSSMQIDVAALPTGTYFVRIATASGATIVKKIIKK